MMNAKPIKTLLFPAIVCLCIILIWKGRNWNTAFTSSPIERLAPNGAKSSNSVTESPKSNLKIIDTVLSSPENNGLARRLPTTLIIGFSKCGTHALRTFLYLHPRIVIKDVELGFFNREYARGLEWYRKQMPESLPGQITIEKTPSYIWSKEAIERMHDFNPALKLIVLVRDPIVRVQSHYAREVWQTEGFNQSFTDWVQGLGDYKIRSLMRLGSYAPFIRDVFSIFDKRQVLILDGERLTKEPVKVLQECEKFLDIERIFKDNFFVFNKKKGFYCFNTKISFFQALINSKTPSKVDRETGCLSSDKGREHPEVPKAILQRLINLYRPTTQDLFHLIGTRLDWSGFQSGENDS